MSAKSETRMRCPCSIRAIIGAAALDSVQEARAAHADAQSGDLRHRSRRGAGDRAGRATSRTAPARRASPARSPLWLWFTVLFATFAEAVAEGRGKAQAATLRATRSDTMAKRLIDPTATISPR